MQRNSLDAVGRPEDREPVVDVETTSRSGPPADERSGLGP